MRGRERARCRPSLALQECPSNRRPKVANAVRVGVGDLFLRLELDQAPRLSPITWPKRQPLARSSIPSSTVLGHDCCSASPFHPPGIEANQRVTTPIGVQSARLTTAQHQQEHEVMGTLAAAKTAGMQLGLTARLPETAESPYESG